MKRSILLATIWLSPLCLPLAQSADHWVVRELPVDIRGTAREVRMCGSRIAWRSIYFEDPADIPEHLFSEIWLYDTNTGESTLVADNVGPEGRNCMPIRWGVSQKYIAWFAFDGHDDEVFLYDISSGITTQVTDDDRNDFSPDVSDSYVVWSRGGGICLYDIAAKTTTALLDSRTDTAEWRGRAHISDSYVAWSTTHVIHLYNIATGMTTEIATAAIAGSLDVSNSYVVWNYSFGDSSEIFLHDIRTGETRQLTNNNNRDWLPRISGDLVVWQAQYSIPVPPRREEWSDFLVYDISTGRTTQLARDEGALTANSGPDVDGTNIAWSAKPSSSWDGILYYAIPIDEPDVSVAANGSESPATLHAADELTIAVSLTSNGLLDQPTEWWVVADTPFGWYSYEPQTHSWRPGLSPCYQGPSFDLSPYEVLYGAYLPVGDYTFYFGVDSRINNTVDPNIDYDSIDVSVEP